ncbi:Protein kinase-like domain [Pseudocohnilembus persalinus]|uniref:non-specific serine/threonine protein kinase n=1 Tax=Pseudocohnilembus persalinus TaxID=266149 RepID=A0A0V0QT15_PSEPJ|nr:Protein kinase-like domain [Pseudocohnilembus persalinus]|eukprot:KRX05325.1 Protein kinase-like domain [Pseudocohnilembus persalinus]
MITKSWQDYSYNNEDIKILVAEDDNFQRIRLFGTLCDLCGYDIVMVENGQKAIQILQEKPNYFNLILIDVSMPEVSGIDLLKFIRQNYKSLPVIMMSADGDKNLIAECLSLGAQNYIVKPVVLESAMGLRNWINPKNIQNVVDPNQENIQNYTKLKKLGEGAMGQVWLVERNRDKKHFAMKIIRLDILSEQQIKQVETESVLLQVLDSPVITKYETQFKDKKQFFIIMEVVDGFDLSTYIKECKEKKTRISSELLMDIFICLIIGIYQIHQKLIIHRDIKPGNIFISNDKKIIKMGDFGIACQLENKLEDSQSMYRNTLIGSPYYVCPEAIKLKKYGQKTDMWSLGVTMYELICLEVPFKSQKQYPNYDDVFEAILNNTYARNTISY